MSVKNAPSIPVEFTTMREPLGNAIDAVLAEDVAGKTALVTGCGPIGLLTIGIARASGATSISASEVRRLRRGLAVQMGATQTWDDQTIDLVEAVRDETHGDGMDVLLEMLRNSRALQQG